MSEKDKCDSFGVGFDAANSDCQLCEQDYNEEFVQCKELTTKKNSPKAEEPKKEPSEKVQESPKKEEGEVKKDRKKALPSVNIKKVCRELIASGKTADEILNAIAAMYVQAGKDEKYSKGRARAVYGSVSKEGKDTPKEGKETPKVEEPKENVTPDNNNPQ